MPNAKILLLDCETAPIRAYTWGLFDQNIGLNQIDRDWYLLSCAYKWLGDKRIVPVGVRSTEDKHAGAEFVILSNLRRVLDESDIVIGHNVKRFDIAKLNAKFLEYKMAPPSPYRTIDTLTEARRHFKMTSNKLDYLASLLGFGNKIKTDFDLWKGCMKGDQKSWDKMLKYNMKDVALLEKVYLTMRPWMRTHPNLGVFLEGDKPACPICGGSHLQRRGYVTTNLSRYQRFQCQDCGGWSRGRANDLDRTNLVAGA